MRQVYWNKYARLDYYKNIDYLLEEWSQTVAQNFINTVSEKIEILKQGKYDFQKTNRPGIRRVVITPHITLFYKIIDSHHVELLRFWNNYQNPDKMNI